MQFVDLKKQYKLIEKSIQTRMAKVFEHGIYIMGPEVEELEAKLAQGVGAAHCIALSSGTDALQIAMMALGVQPGDEVITTPFTFIATAETICLLGAVPVFVDIDPETYNINPELIEAAITPKTKAIMPVNLYGQCADYDPIQAIANQHNLFIIEDAAQSLGATYKGRNSCNLADIGCTSFFPAKPLGCYGDGGACFTNDADLADKMRMIRNHGQRMRYQHVILGLNSRLDSLQAAILLSKLELFDEEVKLRQIVAAKYNAYFQNTLKVPFVAEHNRSVYAQYTLQFENRSEVQQALHDEGIPTAIHYPVPLHQQPIFKDSGYARTPLTLSEYMSERVLSLPFHPYLTDQEIEKVATTVLAAVSSKETV